MNEKVGHTSAASLFFSFIALVIGCGGNVVVDHGNGSGGTAGTSPGSGAGGSVSTTSSSSGIGGTSVTVGSSASSSATTMSTSTTTPGCNSCNDVESGADPSAICPASSQAYQDLLSCSCSGAGACLVSCGNSFCARVAASGPCQSCQSMGCSLQLNACLSM